MKKKGFTIVELLAAIALLGVILVIATISISSVGKKIRQKQRDNLVLDIKIAARRYIANTGLSKVFVQTLIEEGYITTDSDDKNIYDPVTDESLNCYYVSVEEDKEKFIAGDCQLESISNAVLSMTYCSGNNCTPYAAIPSEWINYSQIFLGVKSTLALEDDATYTWITPLSPDLVDNSVKHQIEIPAVGYINDVYEVIVTSNNKEYRASARLKVDIVPPIVSDISVSDEMVYTQSKNINAVITDNESGLAAFAITKDASMPSSDKWTPINEKVRSITQVINENGTYYIWVKDVAGNVNVSSKIEIAKIDTTPPECTLSGENTTWQYGDVRINWGCNDAASGCNPTYSGSNTDFTESAQTDTIDSYIIKDNAGNQTNCQSQTVNLYIDKTAPSVSEFSVTSNEDNYNSKEVTLNATFGDSHSGVSAICISTTNSSSDCSWISQIGTAYTSEYTLNSSSYNGTTFTLYFFAKDVVGNISESKSANYQIYTACTQKEVKDYGNFGPCDETCGGGTKYRDVYYKDSYLGTNCPTVKNGDSAPCNTQACCSEGDYSYEYCTIDGYKYYSRTNGCTNKYEGYKSSEACNSAESCSWGSCDSSYNKTKTCSYYNGGQIYYRHNVDTITCDDTLNDDYYDGSCNRYYVTTCKGNSCNYTIKNGVANTNTITRSSLYGSLPSSCAAGYCGAFIDSNSKAGTKVRFYIASRGDTDSTCTLENYSTGSCTNSGKSGTTGFYATFNSNASCKFSTDRKLTTKWGTTSTEYGKGWTTWYCNNTNAKKGCYCTGNTMKGACINGNTACAC